MITKANFEKLQQLLTITMEMIQEDVGPDVIFSVATVVELPNGKCVPVYCYTSNRGDTTLALKMVGAK